MTETGRPTNRQTETERDRERGKQTGRQADRDRDKHQHDFPSLLAMYAWLKLQLRNVHEVEVENFFPTQKWVLLIERYIVVCIF